MSTLLVTFKNSSGYPDSDVSVGFSAPGSVTIENKATGAAISSLAEGITTYPAPGNWYSLRELSEGVTVSDFVGGRIYVCYGETWEIQCKGYEPGQAVNDKALYKRYDKMEMTFNGKPADVADLTSIDYLGIPMKLQTYLRGVEVETVYGLKPGVTMPDLFEKLKALTTPPVSGWPSMGGVDGDVMPALVPGEFKEYPGGGTPNPIFARIIGPSSYPPKKAIPVFPYDTLKEYLNALLKDFGPSTTVGAIIPGLGGGVFANIEGINGGEQYSFAAHIDEALNITLRGTVGDDKTQQTMKFAFDDLMNPSGIYGGNALFSLNGGPKEPTPNNIYGWVSGDLFAGLNVGAMGSTVEYNNEPIGGMPSHKWFLGKLPAKYYFGGMQPTKTHYNQWAATIFKMSDAYGFAYAERFSKVLAKLDPATVDTLQIEMEPGLLIQADKTWQDTGITVRTGYKVKYVNGNWTANPNVHGGLLYNANGNPDIVATQSGYPVQGVNEGALIGRVGTDGKPFYIGNGPTTVPEGSDGKLYLCINDDLDGQSGAVLTDNKGSICVAVEVPES